LDPFPSPWIVDSSGHPKDCGQHCNGIRTASHDTGSMDGVKIKIDDGVHEATYRCDHWYRPVAHRLHLGESAGLKSTGHQKQISAGKHLMGKRFVVAFYEGKVFRIPALSCLMQLRA
jgi:hypothetical protein